MKRCRSYISGGLNCLQDCDVNVSGEQLLIKRIALRKLHSGLWKIPVVVLPTFHVHSRSAVGVARIFFVVASIASKPALLY